MSIYSVPEQILESVQRDVRLYENYLKKVATRVIAEEISKYPIFIVHKEARLDLGRPIIVAEAMRTTVLSKSTKTPNSLFASLSSLAIMTLPLLFIPIMRSDF